MPKVGYTKRGCKPLYHSDWVRINKRIGCAKVKAGDSVCFTSPSCVDHFLNEDWPITNDEDTREATNLLLNLCTYHLCRAPNKTEM